MIFSTGADAVLDGKKTQTRRPLKPDDRLTSYVRGTPVLPTIFNDRMNRVRYQVGRTYAVQPGRSQKSLGRIRVNRIRVEKLFEMRYKDMIAEHILPEDYDHERLGLPTAKDFFVGFLQAWNRMYDRSSVYRSPHNPEVIVLEFEAVEDYRERKE
jgi:hypothetical protein